MTTNRTWLAVRRQLAAMGCEHYEIGIRNAAGKMLRRTWTVADVLTAIPWLKRENATESDIYVQPTGEQNPGLVLVDDLTQGRIVRMKADGLTPAAVIETSPQNYQVWIRLSARPLADGVATAAAQMLAERYQGDPNSAAWRHFGRLAGMTNRKPEHKDSNGRSPYVLAHETSGKLAPAADAFLESLHPKSENRQKPPVRLCEAHAGEGAASVYLRGLSALHERYGANMDHSRADFMVSRDLARQGFGVAEITGAILRASHHLDTRKAGHQQDYAERTAKAAFQAALAALSPAAPAGGAVSILRSKSGA